VAGLNFRGEVRRQRIEQRRELRVRGIVPGRHRRVYRVELTAMDAPAWVAEEAARSSVLRALTSDARTVWLFARSARYLAERDRDAGGEPRVTRMEWRRCPQCERLLLGVDAAARRQLDESCRTGRQLPCGPDCLERSRRKQGSDGR
jgi:hypothetical protein